ncbi:hypothetical protein BT93_B0119 [Corymbia citriodora subsp. variegata]|nr:hypothetical protein BT93_B0119 [Corymbia citriodora subsp. variegata]
MESSGAETLLGSEYQVFLNFRGDTRGKFTDHLYHALENAGICVFRDEERLDVGENINEALPKAIDNSRIYIPIFSRNYASSPWCLRELVQIVENASKSNGHKEILPIFLDVEPDDVKLKTPLYEEDMRQLNSKRKDKLNIEPVKSWREALKKVGPMRGWEVKKFNGEAKLIKLVVEEVEKKLNMKQKYVTRHLTGIKDQVARVIDMLDIESGGGWLIQIHGMGGIGKTTLAKVVFNRLFARFGKYCCFLEDVREKSSRIDGLVKLQDKLLREMGSANATGQQMERILKTLRMNKVFVVLDDVDKSEQVEKLVGKGDLCSGSRVLITTRKEDVLGNIKPTYGIKKYKMEVMSSNDALKLFSRHAFDKDSPLDDYLDTSEKIVHVIGRLPLTIEVIGSMLHGKENEILWKETLDKLSKTLPEAVNEKLKISYDALTPEQQQIFLDIACFLISKDQTNAIHMWNDYDLSPIDGIEVLRSCSMIRIGENNKFLMHDQLRDLGRGIVRRENLMNPEERSRLWIKEEVLDAIKTKETKNVEAMELDLYPAKESIKSEDIGRFKKLRFLRLYGGTFVGDLMDCFPKLRWIDWCPFDMECELPNMCLKNVVVLEFSMNGIDDLKLRSLIKEASKLKVLTLSECKHITKTPNLSRCSTLEELKFLACGGLRKIDRSIVKLKCLIVLQFHNCPQLKALPEEIGNLENLEHFSIDLCKEIKKLPKSIFDCKSLRGLKLSMECPVKLLGAIKKLEKLEMLKVEVNLKGQLPSEICSLRNLQSLVLEGCFEIPESLVFPTGLTNLKISSTSSLQVVPDLSNLTNLIELNLSDGFEIDERDRRICTSDFRWIESLAELEDLSLCLPHVHAPKELAFLPKLNRLHLSRLDLQAFTQVPSSLLDLTLEDCKSIPLLSSNLKNLSHLKLMSYKMQEIRLDGLQLPNLTGLSLVGCEPLERFTLSSMTKLEVVYVEDCSKLDKIHIAGVLESLEELHIEICESFTTFVYVDIHREPSHESSLILVSRVFNKLQSLWLQQCPKILGIQVFGTSESLEELELHYCCHLQSLGGLSNLKNLKSLSISECDELQIVEGFNKSEVLNNLFLCHCGSLVSTTQLPDDCRLHINKCPKLHEVKQKFNGSVQDFRNHKVSRNHPQQH